MILVTKSHRMTSVRCLAYLMVGAHASYVLVAACSILSALQPKELLCYVERNPAFPRDAGGI